MTPGSPAVLRPRAHLTPAQGWLNDPNGLVHVDGEWHLFFQYHPDSDVWGPMHWGHAVSRDLLRWEELPVALAPDRHGTIFSGSAVVDRRGTAGAPGDLVACFTYDAPGLQVQAVATSGDGGRTWAKHPANPVLLPDDTDGRDFRDPKVLPLDGDDAGWVMVLAAGHRVRLYRSDDLLTWKPTSAFADAQAADLGVHECPDLLRLPVDGGPEHRWVLVLSHTTGGPAGGSGTRYFVGDFDGETFVSEDEHAAPRWVDHGPDFYAAQSWNGAPSGRHVWTGWMSNWTYADRVPSDGWRGVMSLPRELGLRTVDGRTVLVQRPVTPTGPVLLDVGDVPLADAAALLRGVRGAHLDVELVLEGDGEGVVLEVAASEDGAARVAVAGGRVSVDRSTCGVSGFAPDAVVASAALEDAADRDLRVVLDGCTLEVFADDGAAVLSHLVYPADGADGLRLSGPVGARVHRLVVREIAV